MKKNPVDRFQTIVKILSFLLSAEMYIYHVNDTIFFTLE